MIFARDDLLHRIDWWSARVTKERRAIRRVSTKVRFVVSGGVSVSVFVPSRQFLMRIIRRRSGCIDTCHVRVKRGSNVR